MDKERTETIEIKKDRVGRSWWGYISYENGKLNEIGCYIPAFHKNNYGLFIGPRSSDGPAPRKTPEEIKELFKGLKEMILELEKEIK